MKLLLSKLFIFITFFFYLFTDLSANELKTAYKIQIELDLSNALEYLTRVLQRATGVSDVSEKNFIHRKRDKQIIMIYFTI